MILENRERGNYDVHLDLAFNGSDSTIHFNQSYTADPEIAKWLTNADFRRALSLGIDRDQLNETFWLGVGTPGSTAPAESMPQSPGPEWRNKWSTHDPAKANEMLDALGLDKKDRDGFRLRTDNGERLRLAGADGARPSCPGRSRRRWWRDHWRQDRHLRRGRARLERVLAFTRTQQQRAPHPSCGPMAAPSCSICSRATRSRSIRPRRSWGRSSPSGTRPAARRAREPTDPNLKKIFELFRGAAGQKDDERNKTAQEIWKILVDQQYGDRHGRPVAGADGRAARQPQARQHPVARLHRAALPHAGQLASGDVVLSSVSRPPMLA